MICNNCGREIDDRAVICPGCGVPTVNYSRPVNNTQPHQQEFYNNRGFQSTQQYNESSEYSLQESGGLATGALICAFFVPVLGLILGIIGAVNYKNESLKKRSVTAIVVSAVIWILLFILILLGSFLISYF